MPDRARNLPSMLGIFPDYPTAIVRSADGGRKLTMARWCMRSSSGADATVKRSAKLEAKGKQVDFLPRMEPNSGTSNIRNTTSKHWSRGSASRTGAWCRCRAFSSIATPAATSGSP